MRTLLQNANTAYNTQIEQITYVTLFADFPSQQNQIPNPVAQGQIARHARNEERAGNLFYLRAVRCKFIRKIMSRIVTFSYGSRLIIS